MKRLADIGADMNRQDAKRARSQAVAMSPEEVTRTLATLGLSTADLARIVGMTDDRGIRRAMEAGGGGATPSLAFVLRGLLRNHVPEAIGPAHFANMQSALKRRLGAIVDDARRAGWTDSDIERALFLPHMTLSREFPEG